MRLLATVALLGLTATPALAQVPLSMPLDGTVLDVPAEGGTTRVPDIATIRAGVTTQGLTAAAAPSDNAGRMARVLAARTKAGVAPRDVRTATVALAPQYRYADGQAPAVTGYQASNGVAVRFRDVARAGVILEALVAAGANRIDEPALSLDRPEAALDAAQIAAGETEVSVTLSVRFLLK